MQVLTRVMSKAKSVAELLDLYTENSAYANEVHLSALWKRVQQLTGGAPQPSAKQLKELKWVGVKENKKRFKAACERTVRCVVSVADTLGRGLILISEWRSLVRCFGMSSHSHTQVAHHPSEPLWPPM